MLCDSVIFWHARGGEITSYSVAFIHQLFILTSQALNSLQIQFAYDPYTLTPPQTFPLILWGGDISRAFNPYPPQFVASSSEPDPGALGGTLTGDPCSLLGVIRVLPGYMRGILITFDRKDGFCRDSNLWLAARFKP